jgi:AmmeMemoRadiSam system protein B/AmmeMemoRadiSam system protein A
MNPRAVTQVLAVVIVCIALVLEAGVALTYTVRKPVYAGRFYPASPKELKLTIDQFAKAAQKTEVKFPRDRPLRALILPHAGYIYSGPTAAYGVLALSGQRYSKVIVMGTDHRVGFMGASVSDVDAYETPLGIIKCHSDAAKLRKSSQLFRIVPASDQSEHSVEVVLPYLQAGLADFTLVPIVMGSGDVHEFAKDIEPLMDEKTLLVASSDLSHYLPQQAAVARDKETIAMISRLDSDELTPGSNRACGAIPIGVIIECARKNGWAPVLLHYSTSGDVTGDRDQVVGYAAIAFFGGQRMEKGFTKEQGRALVQLARNTIQENLGVKAPVNPALASALKDEAFKAKTGTFVTLTIGKELRGCIGSLEGREPIIDGVKHNALNAAFHDPRFSPLSKKELDKTHIEVSILTEPAPLEYSNADNLLKKLRPGIDGVIIRYEYAGATFLPQVWEQLPKKDDFLSHLCMKAGLPSDAWKRSKLEVQTYQVQYFEEGQ